MSRPRRPLPPLPTTQATANPAHQAQNTPFVRASQPSAIPVVKDDAHRLHGTQDRPSMHSATGQSLRRRGTLFATDGPIPDDFEAPPPFYAIDADRPAFPGIGRVAEAGPRRRERVAYESPPPSPLETSFPNTSQQLPPLHSTPFYSTPAAHNPPSRAHNPPARAISPYPHHGAQQVASAHTPEHARTHSWQPQSEKPAYDPTSFYSAAVSAQLGPAPRQPTRMASMASSLGHQPHSSVSYPSRSPPARPSG